MVLSAAVGTDCGCVVVADCGPVVVVVAGSGPSRASPLAAACQSSSGSSWASLPQALQASSLSQNGSLPYRSSCSVGASCCPLGAVALALGWAGAGTCATASAWAITRMRRSRCSDELAVALAVGCVGAGICVTASAWAITRMRRFSSCGCPEARAGSGPSAVCTSGLAACGNRSGCESFSALLAV